MTIHAACCRCGDWFVLSEEGFGFARNHIGLCPKCSAEVGDLDAAIDRLTQRIRSLGEEARDDHRQLSHAVARRESAWNSIWGLTGSAARFFSALGVVAVSAKPFANRTGPPPSSPNRMTHDWFADIADELTNLDPNMLSADRRTETPPDNLMELSREERRPENVVARANPGANVNVETSLDTSIRASNAEFDTFTDRLAAGESALIPPGPVTVRGVDHVTFEMLDDGRVQIWVNDATKNVNRPPTITDERWQRWLNQDVRPAIDDLHQTNPDLHNRLDQAYREGRVNYRQATVDYSPTISGQGRVVWQSPPPGTPGAHPNPRIRASQPMDPPSRPRTGGLDRAGRALDAVGLVGALINFAAATDSFSTNIGEYSLASREAEDLEKLIEQIEKKIDEATKQKQCLMAEREYRQRGSV